MNVKQSELKEMLKKAISRRDDTIQHLSSSANPQVKDIVTRAKNERDAYQDVLWALEGNTMFLSISGDGLSNDVHSKTK